MKSKHHILSIRMKRKFSLYYSADRECLELKLGAVSVFSQMMPISRPQALIPTFKKWLLIYLPKLIGLREDNGENFLVVVLTLTSSFKVLVCQHRSLKSLQVEYVSSCRTSPWGRCCCLCFYRWVSWGTEGLNDFSVNEWQNWYLKCCWSAHSAPKLHCLIYGNNSVWPKQCAYSLWNSD